MATKYTEIEKHLVDKEVVFPAVEWDFSKKPRGKWEHVFIRIPMIARVDKKYFSGNPLIFSLIKSDGSIIKPTSWGKKIDYKSGNVWHKQITKADYIVSRNKISKILSSIPLSSNSDAIKNADIFLIRVRWEKHWRHLWQLKYNTYIDIIPVYFLQEEKIPDAQIILDVIELKPLSNPLVNLPVAPAFDNKLTPEPAKQMAITSEDVGIPVEEEVVVKTTPSQTDLVALLTKLIKLLMELLGKGN